MQVNRGDVVKSGGETWRVERVDGPNHSIVLYSLDGARQCFPSKDQIEANLSFNERLNSGDISALADLTDEERRNFEAKTWQLFFRRHFSVADCQATRSMLTDFLNGDFVSLAGLEQGLSKLRDKLATRQL